MDQILIAIEKGPHASAMTPELIQLFEEDVAYQVEAGFSQVVLASNLLASLLQNLKISPPAAVSQQNRRARIILDLPFPVQKLPARNSRKMGPILAPSVNESTVHLAPTKPVKLIGHVLKELFEFMAVAPPGANILLGKVDLSDGFWRMIVKPHQRYNFCYVLPQAANQPTRIVIPSALQLRPTPPTISSSASMGGHPVQGPKRSEEQTECPEGFLPDSCGIQRVLTNRTAPEYGPYCGRIIWALAALA